MASHPSPDWDEPPSFHVYICACIFFVFMVWGIMVGVHQDQKWNDYENFEVFIKNIHHESVAIGPRRQNITYIRACRVNSIVTCYLSVFDGYIDRFELGEILPAYTYKDEFHLAQTTRGNYVKGLEVSTWGWTILYMIIAWAGLSILFAVVKFCYECCTEWRNMRRGDDGNGDDGDGRHQNLENVENEL